MTAIVPKFEDTPQSIVATCRAANELTKGRYDVPSLDIAMLRAGAFGWREAEAMFRSPYEGRRPRDAMHDASLVARYAKENNEEADALCKKIGLPHEYQGYHENLARVLWIAYRDIFLIVQSGTVVLKMLALFWANERANIADNAAQIVTHGGTAETREAWNVRARAAIPEAEAAHANRNAVLAKLTRATTVGTFCPHYERDSELMERARIAADALLRVCGAYDTAIKRRKQH